jgi:hypothetical protein
MKKNSSDEIKKEFTLRQTRQIIAMAAALFLVLLMAVLHRRPDLIGRLSKDTLSALQLLLILAFISYSAYNWRCPSCNKFLGGDIHRIDCKKCGIRLR